MPSAFLGLDIAYRALQASQQALQTASHNIANANTPGFSRQEALLASSRPYTVPTLGGYLSAGQVGTGVIVTAMRRFRDAFLDLQIRQETQTLKMTTTQRDTLRQIEMVLPEPSDSGLSKLLDRFWNSWADLSNEPQSPAFRAGVRQEAANLCAALNSANQQLRDLLSNQDTQIAIKVQEVNNIAEQIAALNAEIQKVQLAGNQPNDLRDERDLLLDKLAGLVNITYRESEAGAVSVFIGGTPLVFDFKANSLAAAPGGEIRWSSDPPGASTLEVHSGELGGILRSRNAVLSKISEMDQLANAIKDAVNTIHRQGIGLNGSTGLDFFVGDGAGSISLSDEVLASIENIAAAGAADSPGDGSKAAEISALRSTALADLGNVTAGDFYSALITQLGTDTKGADDASRNQEALVQHLERQRESLSGVSLDEEAANLVRFERAYQAAARVMTTVDEMLDRLINGTGRTGL